MSDPDQTTQPDCAFPVVGIAASAGGLEAFTELIRHLPTDTGMAFVLIQHLSPDHESLLAEILGRATEMPVRQVEDRMGVEPNELYVIPPGTQMTLVDGLLHLAPRQKTNGKYQPGDMFFKSLAADRGSKAIAVVLSGTDGDGSQGLQAVKVAGGVTFAQCEATAQFSSMPETAVATGNVDFVLPPKAIAAALAKLSRSPYLFNPEPFNPEPFQVVKESFAPSEALTAIFARLRTTTGVDFTAYKPNTLNRRMLRRMMLYQFETLEDYAQYLQAHPEEVQALYEEILIHVTRFFRDPEVFEQLKAQVFPTISQNKASDTPLRLWVAGCSTGEEVYSLAICLLEFFHDHATVPPIQLFATDISEAAISKARAGFYLESQMEGVSPERRQRFFVALSTGGYQVSSAVRALCVFARHNLVGDPPFSNLDLVSCRNVLIYLSEPLQERLISVFHYSLNATGFLLLGTAESVKQASDLFSSVHEPAKIYARKMSLSRPLLAFTSSAYTVASSGSQRQSAETSAPQVELRQEVDQFLSSRYAPVFALVNEQMQILQLRGETDLYLKLPSGTTDLNILLMAREGLAIPLRTATYHAQSQNMAVRQEQLRIEAGGRSTCLNLEVIPFQPKLNGLYFLIIFEAVSSPVLPPTDTPSARQTPEALEREIVQLRQALAAATQRELSAQAHLQGVIQEQSSLNQSLRVANEEILSSNEELQSTNEELQTAKEEIQATNEELITTNDELRSRNLQQNRDGSDLNNFVDSISVPILMLTNDLKIRRFTLAAQRLFNFIPSDLGRPFKDLRTAFDLSHLEAIALEVLETLNTQDQEIQTQAGHWYSIRTRPYRTAENRIDGVTIVFFDIDALKRQAATLEAARNYAEAIVRTIQVPLLVLDGALRVKTANQAFCDTFQVTVSETEHTVLFELGNGQWDIPQLRSLLEALLTSARPVQNFQVEHYFEQIGPKAMLLNACKLQQDDSDAMILLAIADITERQQFEAERAQLVQEQLARRLAETANRLKDEFLSNLSHELRNPLNAMLGWAQMLRTRTLSETTVIRALEVIERSARAQSQLIEDILDSSRIISGKLRLNNRLLDLSLVVQAAIETVQLSAEAKNIRILSQLSAAPIVGDADRLQQVLWNLLSNAIKFTPSGGHIEITLEAVQGQAQIRVTDTGQGIAADFLPYIFERFQQGDSSTTKATAGLGLGLSIAKHLVELHGGTLEAESPGEGQGATLTIRLPLQTLSPALPRSSALESTALEHSGAHSSEIGLSLAGLRVLAVDDEMDTCEIFKFVLESYGAEVLTVSSAREALAVLKEAAKQYDVLISDIGLPKEDGYWLIQQVRLLSGETGGHIPAVALTAYASAADRQRAIKAGFQTHLAKPVKPVQLALLVADLAGRTKPK